MSSFEPFNRMVRLAARAFYDDITMKGDNQPKTGRGDNRGMAVVVLDALTRYILCPKLKDSKMQYYVVFVSRRPGVYSSWAECHKNVVMFSGALYHKVNSREEGFKQLEDYLRQPRLLDQPVRIPYRFTFVRNWLKYFVVFISGIVFAKLFLY